MRASPSIVALALAGIGVDVEAQLKGLTAPEATDRFAAERALRSTLTPADYPRIEEAARAGDPEVRRRLARVLGSASDSLPYLIRTYAVGDEGMRPVAEEALRVFVGLAPRGVGGARRTESVADLLPWGVRIQADYPGEPISRFLEDANRQWIFGAPVLLDPAVAPNEPRMPAFGMSGETKSLVGELTKGTDLKWSAYPEFFYLSAGTSPPADGTDVFLRLVRAFETGSPGERRFAAAGLAHFALPAADAFLAETARAGSDRSGDALAGLTAAAGLFAPQALRTPPMVRLLLDALANPDPAIRRGAAHALAAVVPSEPAAADAVLERLDDSSGPTRAALTRMLGGVSGARAKDALLREAASPDPLVAAAALDASVEAGVDARAAAIAALSRRGRTPALLASAERALAATRPGLEVLGPLLASTDPEIRRAVRRLLPRAGADAAGAFWKACAEESDPYSLSETASAARRVADLDGTKDLRAALESALAAFPAESVERRRIAAVAGSVGVDGVPEDLLEDLGRVAGDANDPLGNLAAIAFGRIHGRAYAARALTGVLDDRRKEALLALARRPAPVVRVRGVDALARFLLEQPVERRDEELLECAMSLAATKEVWPNAQDPGTAIRHEMEPEPLDLRERDPFARLVVPAERPAERTGSRRGG